MTVFLTQRKKNLQKETVCLHRPLFPKQVHRFYALSRPFLQFQHQKGDFRHERI